MKNRIRKSLMALIMLSVLIFMSAVIYIPPVTAYAYENIGTSDIKGNMVDVSSNNGIVDFDSLVGNGVQRVCIRLGYGSDISSQDDSQFERNVSECERLGIEYDLYLYSYALDYSDAVSESEHALRLASKCNPQYIWYDMEDADGYKQRHGINVYDQGEMLTDFCIMFMSQMRDNGYQTGIYANSNYFNNVLDYDRLKATDGFNEWRAHWGRLTPPVDCKCWQFGDFGLDSSFDGNIWYGNFNTPIQPADEVDYSHIYERQINDEVNTYTQVKVGGRWLSEVRNDEDYCGIYGEPITAVAISVDKGYCRYRVHTLNGRWLSWIDSDNTNTDDYYNGFAGNERTPIDAIQIEYFTPKDLANEYGYQYATYRTSSVEKSDGYYSGQFDIETSDGQDGYAGVFGRPMDALVTYVTYK